MSSTASLAPSSTARPPGGEPPAGAGDALDRALAAARVRPDVYAKLAHKVAPAAHHRRWLEALARAVETPGARLLLVAPPGSAKSTYTSLMLVLWYLGRWPDRAVLAVTSSDDMAGQFHGVVELGLRLNAARRAVFPEPEALPAPERGWSRDGLYLRGVAPQVKDPSYRCVGFGTKVVGSRCHLLLLDDPVDQKTSVSTTEMVGVRRELDNVLLPRLHPEGSAVAISTRWSETDVPAHLLEQGWELVSTPALGDYPWLTPDERDGEGLGSVWPQRWSREWLEAERRRLGAAQWSTVWMGSPITIGAGVFRADWFRPLPESYPAIAPRLVRCTGVDLAWSGRETADYTAAVTVAYDPHDPQRRLYLVGVWRQRVDEAGLLDALTAHLLAVQPHHVGVERGAFKQAATDNLIAQLRMALYGRLARQPAVFGVDATVDKVARARTLAVHGEAGLVHADRDLPAYPLFEAEALALPQGAHDDLVDASSIATQLALTAATVRQQERPQKVRFG